MEFGIRPFFYRGKSNISRAAKERPGLRAERILKREDVSGITDIVKKVISALVLVDWFLVIRARLDVGYA